MNTTEFFDTLREQKWMLYVPERVYRAHRDGLLRGWGIRGGPIFNLLQSQGADLKVPFMKSEKPSWDQEDFVKRYADHLILHTGIEDCPPLPEQIVTSDSLWDLLVSRFDLVESLTNRVLAWDNWVYRVRFCPVWVAAMKPTLENWNWGPSSNLSPNERREWHRNLGETRDARRVLRKDYGLTGEYFGKNNTRRRAILAVLKKAYPPEQVRRVRRQLEEKLRKDPAEVIRFALERELVK